MDMYKDDSVVTSSGIIYIIIHVLFIHSQNGNTPIHFAAMWGRLDIVKELMKCGAELVKNQVSA